jgi:chorismate synthase
VLVQAQRRVAVGSVAAQLLRELEPAVQAQLRVAVGSVAAQLLRELEPAVRARLAVAAVELPRSQSYSAAMARTTP